MALSDRIPMGPGPANALPDQRDGVGPFAGKVWRIGCMGHTARPRNVQLLLGALEEALAK